MSAVAPPAVAGRAPLHHRAYRPLLQAPASAAALPAAAGRAHRAVVHPACRRVQAVLRYRALRPAPAFLHHQAAVCNPRRAPLPRRVAYRHLPVPAAGRAHPPAVALAPRHRPAAKVRQAPRRAVAFHRRRALRVVRCRRALQVHQNQARAAHHLRARAVPVHRQAYRAVVLRARFNRPALRRARHIHRAGHRPHRALSAPARRVPQAVLFQARRRQVRAPVQVPFRRRVRRAQARVSIGQIDRRWKIKSL